MKTKYTKKQIEESIKHWKKVLESIEITEQVSRSEDRVFVGIEELMKEMESAAKSLGGNVEVLAKDGQLLMYGDTGMHNIIFADLDTANVAN